MEEKYYHPTLLGFIMAERRELKVSAREGGACERARAGAQIYGVVPALRRGSTERKANARAKGASVEAAPRAWARPKKGACVVAAAAAARSPPDLTPLFFAPHPQVEALADLFIQQKHLRRKRDSVKCWRGYMWRRKRARFLMTENIVRYVVDNTSTAWIVFRKWVMREIAIREIQRVVRGYIGRMEAAFLKVLYNSVTLLQATYRGKLARRKFLGVKRKRNWAAAEMQRHIR
jgi:hypothetical protein